MSCVNNAANNIGWGALFTYTAEVHPTELRALGCGITNAIKSFAVSDHRGQTCCPRTPGSQLPAAICLNGSMC